MSLFVGIARQRHIAVGLLNVYARGKRDGQFAFRPLDQHLVPDDDFHALRQRNYFISYSRHKFTNVAQAFLPVWILEEFAWALTITGTTPRHPRVLCAPCFRS